MIPSLDVIFSEFSTGKEVSVWRLYPLAVAILVIQDSMS
jgi:hypothetical protein